MKIGNFEVGRAKSAFVIAEACDNHMGRLSVAKEMALRAKLANANAVKFQHHIPREEMLPDVPKSGNFSTPLFEFLERFALSIDDHRELKAYCDEIGICYLCTPFSLAAALEIADMVPAFKIGSGEMTDTPFIEKIVELGKPIIVSTGMSSYEEIDRTYNILSRSGVDFALMNCVSEYPPVYEDMNLGVITEMRNRYPDAVIGHSDHAPDLYTSFAAVTLGASILEKHVILDKRVEGPDQSVSIDFNELAALVDGVRKIYASMGNVKQVHKKEAEIRAWAFRSLVTIQPMNKGEVFTERNLWSKRPGTGIPSHRFKEFLGRKAARDLEVNALLDEGDFE